MKGLEKWANEKVCEEREIEQLIKLLEEAPGQANNEVYSFAEIADHLIANGVTIPVRCKNCAFWSDGVAGCTDHVKICTIGFYMIGENGFCSFGEIKDTADKTE